MRWLVFLVLCGGCRQLFGIGTPDHLEDARLVDGTADVRAIDSLPDTPPGASCYGTGFGRQCFVVAPTGSVTLPQTIDTDSSIACGSTNVIGNPFACVISGTTITAGGGVAVTGSKPLVLVATDSITVSGTLDVSSKRGGQIGAGSAPNGTLCDRGTGTGLATGGGAGGSFGSVGGHGGTSGGSAGLVKPAALRGGCSGQDGGAGAGQHGVGGGAVYLIAGMMISVTGTINASGGGGSGGTGLTSSGGSGGGSGGLIAFDAPTVTMTSAKIFANGGGGGEGAGGNNGAAGKESIGGAAGAGGTGGTANGGDGGEGAAMTLPGGDGGNGNGNAGGGGGGGGGGVIALFQATSISGIGVVSPPPS